MTISKSLSIQTMIAVALTSSRSIPSVPKVTVLLWRNREEAMEETSTVGGTECGHRRRASLVTDGSPR